MRVGIDYARREVSVGGIGATTARAIVDPVAGESHPGRKSTVPQAGDKRILQYVM